MKKSIRVALLTCALFSALAFTNGALASYTPRLVVTSLTPQGAAGGAAVRIGAVVANADDPTARVQIYIPNGYQLAAPAAGTKLGDVTATAAAADLGGAILPLTGELQSVAPNPVGAAVCGVAASQYWNLHLTAAGQVLDIPMYVVTGSAAEQAIGYQAKLVVCLPPPDLPPGTPGRAQFGAKLLTASFGSSAITEPTASGDYRWTSLFTPYTPTKGTANAAGTVETQSIQHIPTAIKLTVTKKKLTTTKIVRRKGKRVRVKTVRTRVTFSSTVTENGVATTSATITTTAGGKRVGGTAGSFLLTAKSTTLTATALVNHQSAVPSSGTVAPTDVFYRDLGASACTPTAAFTGLPCAAATLGSTTVKATVTVRK